MRFTKFAALLVFIVGVSASAGAQNAVATIAKSGAVVLPESEPLKSAYQIDASSFNFETNEDAIEFFQTKNSTDVSYRPVLHNGIVMVYIQTKKHPEWTASQWNAYFAEHKVRSTETNHQSSK